jgi:hypothetical protein
MAWYFVELSESERDILKSQDDRWNNDILELFDKYLRKQKRVKRYGRASFQDGSKSKVYRAEWKFQAEHGSGKTFQDYSEAEKYIKKVIKSKTWSKLGGRSNVRLVEKKDYKGRSRTAGMAYTDGRLQLCPSHGLNEYTVLHELAHLCGHMHHDLSFRLCLVSLVSRFMGRDNAKALKKAFRDGGLKMSRRSPMTPERWLESYFRMEDMRKKL